jgi:hypothetical protein
LIADALREYLQAPAQFGVKLLCFTLSIDNPQPRIRKLATIVRSAANPMRNKSPHSPYGLGFGASAFFFQKTGDGVAIYVEPK